MASTPSTIATMAGLLKPVFGELQDMLPEEAILQDLFPFAASKRVGKYFEEPLEVVAPWGNSYLGSQNTATVASTLNDAEKIETVDAQISSFPQVLRVQVSNALLDRSSGGDKTAFQSMAELRATSMARQMRRTLEISMLTGQEGIGEVESWDDTGTGGVVTLTAASVRTGILAILQNALLDTYQSDGTTIRSNSSGLRVSSTDPENRTITISNEPDNDPQAGDFLFIRGSGYSSTTSDFGEMVGLRKQVRASSGTVFGVNKASYLAYRGTTVPNCGPVSEGLVCSLLAKAAARGFSGEMVVVMSAKGWGVLNSKTVSQRVFDSSYSPSKAEVGVDAIHVKSNGIKAMCVSHPYQADGEILCLPKDYVVRVGVGYAPIAGKGSKDIDFRVPGSPLEWVFPIVGSDVTEFQCRSDQAIYNRRPNFSVLGTGVTY